MSLGLPVHTAHPVTRVRLAAVSAAQLGRNDIIAHHSAPRCPHGANGTEAVSVSYGDLLAGVGCSAVSASGSGHRVPAASNCMGTQHQLRETSSLLSTQMSNIMGGKW